VGGWECEEVGVPDVVPQIMGGHVESMLGGFFSIPLPLSPCGGKSFSMVGLLLGGGDGANP